MADVVDFEPLGSDSEAILADFLAPAVAPLDADPGFEATLDAILPFWAGFFTPAAGALPPFPFDAFLAALAKRSASLIKATSPSVYCAELSA